MSKSALLSVVLLCSGYFFLSSTKDPNNPPVARTGAPGESTCGVSGCHSGGTYVGTVTISGIPDTIALNTSYSVTLTQKSNAKRAGFELTCLDGSNTKCGTLTTGSGTSVASQSSTGRQYVRQSSPKTISTADSTASWTFTWKSPTTAPSGNVAKFFFVSLAANANGAKSGDNPLLGSDTVYYVMPVISGIGELATPALAKIYPAAVTDYLHVDLENSANGYIRIYNMEGALVYKSALSSSSNTILLGELAPGDYVAQLESDGKTMAKRLIKI